MTESASSVPEVPPLHESLASPLWDSVFWEALSHTEQDAMEALWDLQEAEFDRGACGCTTCVVRTVLEAVWPTLTMQFQRLLELSIPPSTLHCSRTCRGREA